MATSTIGTLFEMIHILVSNTIGTLGQMFTKLGELAANLQFVSEAGGLAGVIIAVSIGAIVFILFAKFVLGAGKTLIFLFTVGLLILIILSLLL
ncbi:MAG: hypothetical protein DRP76_04940 [Candidatus Omnitrophota bacterium]|nr:MAG: hypothetical protein DRP76_04940 [Candidatus Omnitrophota bacterium]